MAKRSSDNRNNNWLDGEWVEQTDEITGVKFESRDAVESNTIRLTLLRDVIYKYKGKSTGREYVWNGAGSQVDVDKNDAEYLLNKESYRSCCDSYSTPSFEISK